MFYTNHHEAQEDSSDHTNGAGNTSESNESSHTYTQIQCLKRLEFETQKRACSY